MLTISFWSRVSAAWMTWAGATWSSTWISRCPRRSGRPLTRPPFGRQAMEEDHGCFTSRGYLSLSGDEWQHEHVAERPHREAEKKPSIRERLEQGKKECANRQAPPQARGKSEPEL